MASTCSDGRAQPCQFAGACRSPGATGSRAARRWRCTVSTVLRANAEHKPLWSSSSESWVCKMCTLIHETSIHLSLNVIKKKSDAWVLHCDALYKMNNQYVHALSILAFGVHCTFCGGLWCHLCLGSKHGGAAWPKWGPHTDHDTKTEISNFNVKIFSYQ